MYKKYGVFALILSSALLPIGCNKNQSVYSRTEPPPYQYQYPEQYGDYEVWVGPGWYYGVYFSNRGYYRDWQRRHYHRRWGYGYPRYRRYYYGRQYRWRGGHPRHGGRGRGRGGRGRGRR